jgi:hypothetical protein
LSLVWAAAIRSYAEIIGKQTAITYTAQVTDDHFTSSDELAMAKS